MQRVLEYGVVAFGIVLLFAIGIAARPTTPNEILIATGRQWHVRSLQGKQHSVLQREAEYHAAYQARVQTQGHQNWDQRYRRMAPKLPDCTDFSEVANESWPDQNTYDAANEMYRSWKLSPGHWSAVNGHCKYWGYAMVKGKNGVWYACGIFAR